MSILHGPAPPAISCRFLTWHGHKRGNNRAIRRWFSRLNECFHGLKMRRIFSLHQTQQILKNGLSFPQCRQIMFGLANLPVVRLSLQESLDAQLLAVWHLDRLKLIVQIAPPLRSAESQEGFKQPPSHIGQDVTGLKRAGRFLGSSVNA